MKIRNLLSARCLVFKKWSRKSYAIFVSLKKVVKIAHLSVDICKTSFCKHKSLISFLKNTNLEKLDRNQLLKDFPDFESLLNLILSGCFVAVPQRSESIAFNIHLNTNRSPLFASRKYRTF